MKLSTILEIIFSIDNYIEFKESLHASNQSYFNNKISGKSIHVVLEPETNIEIRIGMSHVVLFAKAFKFGYLDNKELALITDMILLSNNVRFDTEKTKELLEIMTDPEVNGIFNLELANEILKEDTKHMAV